MPIELDAADVEVKMPEKVFDRDKEVTRQQTEPWDDEIFSGPDEEPQGDGKLLLEHAAAKIAQLPDALYLARLRAVWQEFRLACRNGEVRKAEAKSAETKTAETHLTLFALLDELLLTDATPAADKPQEELTIAQINLPVGVCRMLESNFRTFADLEDYRQKNGTFATITGIGKKKAAVIEAEYKRIIERKT